MKFRCTVCGHVYDEEKEGVKFADLPADWKCPICKQPKSKFEPIDEAAELTWASEHKIGIASDLSDDMKDFLRAEFAGECSEVGMYLAMSRAAIRQGYRKSVLSIARQRLKRQTTLPALRRCWARSYPLPPRRTLRLA